MICTGAFLSACAAVNPPKPAPRMTTRGKVFDAELVAAVLATTALEWRDDVSAVLVISVLPYRSDAARGANKPLCPRSSEERGARSEKLTASNKPPGSHSSGSYSMNQPWLT